ncbi:MAG: divalent metal cation transporter [Patescibacteria group bacterium]|nr:divalent metal cation transporter [Patescibacteria group bacterium]
MERVFSNIRKFIKLFGPGLITGAADDDPSGIATYTQTGAQFGYGQLWTVIFILPLMTAVQEACARIGVVSGKGIAAVIKERYGKNILYLTLLLVLLANTINIGADLGAMGAAAQLIVPLPFAALTLFFTALILVLEIFMSYRAYARVLKWLALALFSYVLTLLFIAEPWRSILLATFVPHIEFNTAFLFILTGVIGTTISPYMFFWEASQEVEEERERRMIHGGVPAPSPRYLRRMRIDNFIGMLSSQIATWSIIVVAATVLNGNGITNVATSADAARALEPLVHTFPYAGTIAKFFFAIGIIGLGLLAVPVLSASASYVVAETLNWREGLNLKLRRAHGFYGIITVATLLGLLINFIGIDPIRALVITAVINGIIAVPLIYIIGRLAQNSEVMGEFKSGLLSKTLVWITFAFMGLSALALLITSLPS